MRLSPDPSHYWPQTGMTYRFTYQGLGKATGAAQVIENQRHLDSITIDPQGVFSYTPPHDPDLDREGPSAYKQTVLLVEQQAGRETITSTFTLLLHRSRYGHHRLLPGLALIVLVALAVLFGVIRKRRKSPF